MGLTLLASGVVAEAATPADPGGRQAATAWWFRLKSTGYSSQTERPPGSAEDRFGFYQVYDGTVSGLADGRLSFRAAGRFADDLAGADLLTDRNRLYNGYAQWSTRTWRSRTRLGRQFLQEGPTSLTLDGLFLSVHPHARFELKGWGGARAPVGRTYDLSDFGDETAFGARLVGRPLRRLDMGLSWSMQKSRGVTDAQLVGLEAAYDPRPGWRFLGRAAYETERETWDKVEILGRLQPRRDLPVLALQYLDRRPAIDASSYFARFGDPNRIRIGRATLRYERRPGYGIEIEYFGSFNEERVSTRLSGTLLVGIAHVGYSVRLGDAGEESRVFGDLSYRPLAWLDLAAGATLATYALLEDAPVAEERDLVTAFARVGATVRPGMHLVAEVQGLDNPFYEEDVRLLVGLDLLSGRGPSRFGLGRGGWLQ